MNPGTLNLSTSILFTLAQADIQAIVLDKRDEDLLKDLKFDGFVKSPTVPS